MSKERPIFSIITPVYNNESIIEYALKSVLTQDFEDYEYIIIDDGSTDNTPKILDEIAKSNRKINVIHQSNKWIYASFNRGIREAKGEYIFILNSDDRLKPNVLEKAAKIIDKFQRPDILFGQVDTILIGSNGEIYRVKKGDYLDEQFMNKEKFRERWIDLYEKKYITTQAHFYKKDTINNKFFQLNNFMADRYFNVEIARDINNAYILEGGIYEQSIWLDNRNASKKYYSNNHEKANELYLLIKNLMFEWGKWEANKKIVANKRLTEVTFELLRINSDTCPLSLDEKVEYILKNIKDRIVDECCFIIDDNEQLDARILNGLKNIYLSAVPNKKDKMYFVYEMISSLLCYEKDENDLLKIKSGVYDNNNPYHIGESFYKQCVKNI